MTLILNDNIGNTTTQCDSFVGVDGQIIHDKQAKTIRVMDGTTAGGTSLAKKTHTHTKSEITDFSHTHTVSQITDYVNHLVDVPESASASGAKGDYAVADGFLYICVAAGTWQRVAIATWSDEEDA